MYSEWAMSCGTWRLMVHSKQEQEIFYFSRTCGLALGPSLLFIGFWGPGGRGLKLTTAVPVLMVSQTKWHCVTACVRSVVDSGWNMTAHGDAREGKRRGNWQMEWVASTLHTTSKLRVSSITTADAHTSATSSRLNRRPRRFKWPLPFRQKTKSGFCACAITFQLDSTTETGLMKCFMVHGVSTCTSVSVSLGGLQNCVHTVPGISLENNLTISSMGPQSPLDMKPDTANLLGSGNFSPTGGGGGGGGPNSPK
jgi:hypothetical protein